MCITSLRGFDNDKEIKEEMINIIKRRIKFETKKKEKFMMNCEKESNVKEHHKKIVPTAKNLSYDHVKLCLNFWDPLYNINMILS